MQAGEDYDIPTSLRKQFSFQPLQFPLNSLFNVIKASLLAPTNQKG